MLSLEHQRLSQSQLLNTNQSQRSNASFIYLHKPVDLIIQCRFASDAVENIVILLTNDCIVRQTTIIFDFEKCCDEMFLLAFASVDSTTRRNLKGKLITY